MLGIDKAPLALELSLKSESELTREFPTDIEMESIPLMEISFLAEDIYVKAREASQDTYLDMQEFLEIDKVLLPVQGELVNNISKSFNAFGARNALHCFVKVTVYHHCKILEL